MFHEDFSPRSAFAVRARRSEALPVHGNQNIPLSLFFLYRNSLNVIKLQNDEAVEILKVNTVAVLNHRAVCATNLTVCYKGQFRRWSNTQQSDRLFSTSSVYFSAAVIVARQWPHFVK